jgi:glycosyltransferase involved in cell wall biosynthesis
LIVEVAKIFKDKGSLVEFVLIGDGPLKDVLKAKAEKYHLDNLEIMEYQEKENLFKLISECNLGLITYELNDTFRKNIPSKIFDYMFLEKPVLINLEGEASKMILDGNFGFCYETSSPIELYNRTQEIVLNREGLEIKGHNGFEYLKENFDKKELLKRLDKVLEVE